MDFGQMFNEFGVIVDEFWKEFRSIVKFFLQLFARMFVKFRIDFPWKFDLSGNVLA